MIIQSHYKMFIRELELSKDSAIRNNIIIIIGDVCSKLLSLFSSH